MTYNIITTSGGYKRNLRIDADREETAVIVCKMLGMNFALRSGKGRLIAKSEDTVYNALCMTKVRYLEYIHNNLRQIVQSIKSCREEGANGFRNNIYNFRAYASEIAETLQSVYGGK